jgi:hypothetical protein
LAKNDWIEVLDIFNTTNQNYLIKFLESQDKFCPSIHHINIFDIDANAFSSKLLNKPKPGNWIPIYKKEDLPEYFLNNNLMPIRCGQAEFFFFKGDIFFDLTLIDFTIIDIKNLTLIDNFLPLTLENFHKNENAYLNKALSRGILNHFIDDDLIYRRLLYGQFGKIKTNFELEFKTSHGIKEINKGFQFEIDFVLENKDEIIIFEAKQGSKSRTTFSLLQLYYPLIYLTKITNNQKKIRTIFIDIISNENNEIYKLTELEFINCEFANLNIIKSIQYF